MLERFDLDKTYQYLLISLAFLMPLTVSGANTIIVIICFLWLLSGDYKSKYIQIMSSKLMIASLVFYCLHIIGMLWTDLDYYSFVDCLCVTAMICSFRRCREGYGSWYLENPGINGRRR